MRNDRGPLVSVVLTVSDEETVKIAPAIASLQQQRHGNLDVVVVAWGRCQRVLTTARKAAAGDSRIRVVREPAADLAAARNLGARRARGAYLTFLVGADDLPPRGIERLVQSLERSGSALAVGMAEAPESVLAATTAPHDAAHHRNRIGTTLEQTPMAITDLSLGNRMFRRDFWKSAGLVFDPTGGDSAVAVAAFAAAPAFDLSRHATYLRSQRRDAALGTLPVLLDTLDDWIREQRQAWHLVQAISTDGVADAWLWGVLDTAIQPFIDDVERADDQEWEQLCEAVDLLLDRSGPEVSKSLRAESRVRLWLLRERRREQLEAFVAQRWFEKGNRRTRVEAGRVLAELPFFGDPEAGIPDDCFEMTEGETPLQAILTGVRWPSTQVAELDLFVRARYVGMPEAPSISVDLVHPGTSARVPIEVRRHTDARANQFMADKYQDYSRGAVTLVVDTAAVVDATSQLAGTGAGEVDWEFQVTLETQGLRRSGRIEHLDDRGSAGMLGTGHLGARAVGSSRVAVAAGGDARAAVRVSPGLDLRLDEVAVEGRTVHGRLAGERPAVSVEARYGATTCTAPVVDGAFSLGLPTPSTGGVTWRLRARGADGGERMVAWPEQKEHWLCAGSGGIVPVRSVQGSVDLREAADLLVLTSARLGPEAISVTGEWLAPAPKHVRLTLRGPRSTIVADSVEIEAGRLVATFPTTWDEWGFGPAPVPVGRYWFELSLGPADRPRAGKVLLSEGMLDVLLDQQFTDAHRFRAIRLGRDAGVFLSTPVADESRGGHNRQRLVDWVNSDELPIEQGWVYFQSYAGATATDSQLAIFHEVRRSHPDLVCWWGIADLASRVPAGAQPVVIGSEEWFRVLGSSRRLVMNIDLDRWFSPRPGQELLQTFHGYPAKTMGAMLWEAKHYTPRRIAAELERTSADWDLILTPAPEMDEYYRREYRYDGPIHNEGYPRDDVLVSADADRIREETRTRLGIAPGQKAVLYAPTWRDDQATNWRSAELTRHLDLEAASAHLGPDYVLLMRGHRFHARAGERSTSTARLLDVTDYPEINDLILASDAAVLDYSSLRFDFALTGRPMLFLVPDLADYVRGFLYSFEDSAPGPLLDSADEVIERLRDLPALTAEYADEVARFNATFNRFQDGRAAERVVRAFFGG